MHMCILGMEHPSSVLDFLNSSYFRTSSVQKLALENIP